mgnify:CR=1 FL=1
MKNQLYNGSRGNSSINSIIFCSWYGWNSFTALHSTLYSLSGCYAAFALLCFMLETMELNTTASYCLYRILNQRTVEMQNNHTPLHIEEIAITRYDSNASHDWLTTSSFPIPAFPSLYSSLSISLLPSLPLHQLSAVPHWKRRVRPWLKPGQNRLRDTNLCRRTKKRILYK